jgi:hypothetical protein
MSENMHFWNKLKSVPANRLKTIQAGRLKGKSDINPQWRYEVLTENFGICGIGWKYTIDKQWIEKYDNGEIACFANISLFVKINGEWSDAIPANGGSMFVANERNGAYVSDECYKMAITDALGTAAKMIGVASDVYQGINDTKYSQPVDQGKPINQDKPYLNKGQSLNDAINYLKNGGNIATIEKKYKLSKEIRDSLQVVIDNLNQTNK